MIAKVNINGTDINFEIDTGTYAAAISKRIYREYFSDINIVKTDKDLRAYGGQSLVPIGELVDLTAAFNNTKKIVKCFVLPGSGPALVGRQWLQQFGAWPLKIPYLNMLELNKLDTHMHDYITKGYKILFDDSPGIYNKSTTKIHLKENTRPVALKCRHVAHALKTMVEKEIERLIGLGHLEPVDVAEWATPIVPVLKGNGEVRVCGDFKLTLNPNIIIDKYSLHTIDDIFAKLQGGVSFSELDCNELVTVGREPSPNTRAWCGPPPPSATARWPRAERRARSRS